jgi:hypothetical protein
MFCILAPGLFVRTVSILNCCNLRWGKEGGVGRNGLTAPIKELYKSMEGDVIVGDLPN